MEKEAVINQRIRDFSKPIDRIQTILLYLGAFLVPTFLGQLITLLFGAQSVIATNSQLIVGSIVNAILIITAANLKGFIKIAGVITMPSISAIMGGYVFHTASVYASYMILFIWLGNLALVYAYKFIMIAKRKNYFLAGLVGIITKVAIIFSGFCLLKSFNIFPEKIVTVLQVSMGTTQAITATIGVLLAFGVIQLINRSKNEC